ncbi:FxSxx-COOH system tetratricopeptide repeat protein [Candidatus Albibeggiatoa sp. nov. BB20]|uniref:FxSxx-COOH system tetratricopeptide repeat protein n=1 Tax=Candidatus Albibeggiatoa sp. nov. BB20 TaxID=3162723 RepID=UPI0033654ADB
MDYWQWFNTNLDSIIAGVISSGIFAFIAFYVSRYMFKQSSQPSLTQHSESKPVLPPINISVVGVGGGVENANVNTGSDVNQNIEAAQASIQNIPITHKLPFSIPIPKNSYFTGRQKILEQIKTELLKQPVALVGLGGMGKSHTAAHFAYLHEQDYEAVFWVVADTQQNLISHFAQLAQRLTDEPVIELDKQFALVQRWLSQHRNWLLIVDNVEPEVSWRAILADSMRGQILLTSRAKVLDDRVKSIALEKMSVADSQNMILRQVLQKSSLRNIAEVDKNAARELAKLLDGLPLALSQACAYIQQTADQGGIANYVQLYKTDGYKLMKKRGKVTEHDHLEPVAITWKLSYQKLAKENPATIELLRVCAFLDADEIPEEIFLQGIEYLAEDYRALKFWQKWRNRLFGRFKLAWTDERKLIQLVGYDSLRFNDILSSIQQFSLLQRDATNNMLSMHRLVQDDIRADLTPEQQQDYGLRAVRLLAAVFHYDKHNLDTWSKPERLLASSLKISYWINQLQLEIEASGSLLNQLAFYLDEVKANYSQALPLYERSLAIWEKVLGEHHPDVAQSLNNLAELYRNQGKYEQALPLFEHSLAIWEKVLGEHHPDVATSLNNLALLYSNQGKYEQALPLYERSLAILEKVLGEHHPLVAQSLNNLATLYYKQGKYKEALPLFEHSLAIMEKVLGEHHPNVATSLNNLALLYKTQGKYEQALPLYERSLAIWEKVLGEHHPDVASSLNNLAALYEDQGKYEQALPLYERSLAIREKVLGEHHPDVATSLNNLAGLYDNQGKYEQALPLYERSLAILQAVFDENHPHVKMCKSNYEGCLRAFEQDATD